jgi:hypothetical protein
MKNTPAPTTDLHNSRAGCADVVADDCDARQVHRAAVLYRPQAERAVVPVSLIAADEPVEVAHPVQIDESSAIETNTSHTPGVCQATFPQRVKVFCERLVRLMEARFGFGERDRDQIEGEASAKGSAASRGGAFQSSRPPNT